VSTIFLTDASSFPTIKVVNHNKELLINLSQTGSTHIRAKSRFKDSEQDRDASLVSYQDYIKSPEWIDMKDRSKKFWGSACLVCGSNGPIDRHHLFYRDDLTKTHPSEIIPLCSACHEAAHEGEDNKNGQPSDKDALKSLVNKLFFSVVRRRNLPTSMIAKAHQAFWPIFNRYVKALFTLVPLVPIRVTTKTTKKKTSKAKARRQRRGKAKKNFSTEMISGGIHSWSVYKQQDRSKRYASL